MVTVSHSHKNKPLSLRQNCHVTNVFVLDKMTSAIATIAMQYVSDLGGQPEWMGKKTMPMRKPC